MLALLERSGPLKRLPFLLAGVGLFAVKIGADYLVSRAFGQDYSLLYYVSPMEAPLMHPDGREMYWLAMWGVALPFIGLGVWLSLRRLMDASLPAWLVGLFFVPFANLIFFLATAAVPSREAPTPGAEAIRAEPSKSMGTAVVMGGAVGAVVSLGMVGISVGLLEEYGAALFLGAPTLSAFLATLTFGHLHGPNVAGSFAASMLALFLAFAVLIGFAIEGLVCLLMASPLAIVASILGWAVAFSFVSTVSSAAPRTGGAALCILPLWLVLEVFTPYPAEHDRMIESVVEVDAPPDVVWNRVLAFEELPEPHELIFRAGVSAPTGAVIEGEGVGAVRRCRFTTGEFVEPITVWDPGHELSFDVLQQPDPMREMTPYGGPRPPHLDGYFATTRGQFLLEELPGGRTRLRGRTWYSIRVFPRDYWAFFAEDFMHTIHLRVMNQIALMAERDHRSVASGRGREQG